MQTTATVKVGAAFLAGIVVALGSATIYFHASGERAKPPVTVLESTPESATPVPAEKPAVPESAPPIVNEPVIKKPVVKRVKRVVHVNGEPVSLAVANHPADLNNQLPPQSAPPLEPPPSDPVAAMPEVVPPQPAVRQPHTVTIPAGTNLVIRLGEKLSTEHNYVGDTFRATLDAPVVMDGFIIADRGAKVLGRIVKAQKPGKMEGAAELSLVLTEVSTTDGQRLAVDTNESLRKGPSNTNEEVVKMAGAAAIGAIIGALAGGGKGAAIGAGAGGAAGTGAVLLGHGRPAVIASETRLTFELAHDTPITEKLN